MPDGLLLSSAVVGGDLATVRSASISRPYDARALLPAPFPDIDDVYCGGEILFETLQKGTTLAPKRSFNAITVVLDDDGNVTVVVER